MVDRYYEYYELAIALVMLNYNPLPAYLLLRIYQIPMTNPWIINYSISFPAYSELS
ncbi:hypothetical protein [Nostoc sp. CENA543]|uniref:hypothetical protein n=1 Tax=Nostoc sp. CENA543 TaxID=1869241 RepID=UPI001CEF5B3C|nr:hypothetical protein [Nostoc sp. CENA543]